MVRQHLVRSSLFHPGTLACGEEQDAPNNSVCLVRDLVLTNRACLHIWECLYVIPVCSDGSEEQRNIRQHSPNCGLLPGLYASSSPSPPRSLLTLLSSSDPLLNYRSVILVLQKPPPRMHTPPHRLLFPLSQPSPAPPPLSSHLFWATDPASSTAPLCTATLRSRPLPVARLLIGIGGEERIAVRHGRPLEPTEPGQGHSHHSCVAAAHSKRGRRRESEGCRS